MHFIIPVADIVNKLMNWMGLNSKYKWSLNTRITLLI
jgi:hypothetical protein